MDVDEILKKYGRKIDEQVKREPAVAYMNEMDRFVLTRQRSALSVVLLVQNRLYHFKVIQLRFPTSENDVKCPRDLYCCLDTNFHPAIRVITP